MFVTNLCNSLGIKLNNYLNNGANHLSTFKNPLKMSKDKINPNKILSSTNVDKSIICGKELINFKKKKRRNPNKL